ncbi:MAG: hypothetical protein M3033_12820 [Acidobacteriota bacterium]|nr:hypothetical protein [Acidobacteriota bacterium]
MRKVLFFVLILISVASVFAQKAQTFDLTNYGVRVEPDKRLITVLASLEAAGVETPLTAKGMEFRRQLQSDLQTINPELRQKIKTFFDQYKRRRPKQTPNELVAPFISMAYSLSPVPDLSDPVRATDLPGDLLEVLDYAPLAREFYRSRMEIKPNEFIPVSAKIDEYVKTYQSNDTDLRRSAGDMVGELLDYLHTKPQLVYVERVKTQSQSGKNKKTELQKIETRNHERRFFIVPEMLAPKGTVNFLNIGDDYFAVVPLETDLSQSEARRAYLQFVIDPLVLTNSKDLSAVSGSIKNLLDERRKANPNVSPDPFLAVSRSLVAAIDARQIEFKKTQAATMLARQRLDKMSMNTIEQKRAVSANLETFKKSLADETALQLSEAYEKGAVLSFYFADQLKGLENSGFDIASSFRDIILSLDATKETNRLAQFADARQRAITAREARKTSGANQSITITNPVTEKLLEIDKIVQSKNYLQAESELKRLLEANPSESPRIYYAIGRNASLSAELITDVEKRNLRLLDAKVAYENVLRSATPDTDRALISLSYVALGRLYEYDGNNDYAVKIYEAAIRVGDVAEGAYKEAVASRERLLKKQ